MRIETGLAEKSKLELSSQVKQKMVDKKNLKVMVFFKCALRCHKSATSKPVKVNWSKQNIVTKQFTLLTLVLATMMSIPKHFWTVKFLLYGGKNVANIFHPEMYYLLYFISQTTTL